jgi:hypothetical protein
MLFSGRTQERPMWKALWQTWTVDKPAAFGDWLWDVFVVPLADLLNRLTWRRVVAFVPLVILFLAYAHDIPVSPALIFVGDLLAYIDIFAVLFLLGLLSRAATILFIVRQAAARIAALASGQMARARRLDVRHRRERGSRSRPRPTGRPSNDDDVPVGVAGLAYA